MVTLKRSFLSLLSLLFLLSPAFAQREWTTNPTRDSSLVTAAVNGERLRFAATSSVVQIRLEVYTSTGDKIFDNEVRGGNVLDWHLEDGQAAPLADDSYLCVVTVKSLSGRITQRIGSVRVENRSASVHPVDPSQITDQQAQAIGPVEDNASLTLLKEDDHQTTTVIAHNGEDGLITRGRGALSFRIGDFFSGKDQEQMRLTAEGNLGIGISHPQVRLDVDGLVRASQGIVFPDGSIQYSAATKTYGAKSGVPDPSFQSLYSKSGNKGGQEHIDTAGTGTQNVIAKWAETGGNGTLQNSGIFETAGGDVGIGSTNPLTKLDVDGALNIGGSNLYLGGSLRFTDNVGAGYTNFVALKGNLTNFDGINYEQLNLYNPGGDKAIHLAQTAAGSQIASIGAGNTTLSLQPSGGNVGIGTPSPSSQLHVVGNGLFTGNLTVNGTLNAPLSGDGSGLTNLNASNLASGTVPSARLGLIGIANGGTGISTGPTATGQFLRSTGSGAWGVSVLTVNDIPDLGASYIKNSTSPQAGSDFNISGNGTANIFNATTQFNIGGSRVFSVNGGNVSANGVGPVVNSNTFAGTDAGASVIPDASTFAGNLNTFFGVKAGTNTAKTSPAANAFDGCCNSFFGNLVGLKNTTGHSNAFFGGAAGIGNTTGSFNSFFGDGAGSDFYDPNVARTGSLNTFIGSLSGGGVTTGSSNTFLGANTSGTSNLTNATAIGANAAVTQSNSLVLGNGFANVGIGTSAPLTKLDVRGDLVLDNGGNPTLYTSVASAEQNRYLKLINSPSVASASGLKAGGILVADDYGYGFPTKNDLIVKGFVGIGLGANVAPANPLHVAGDIRIGTGLTGCVLDADGTIIAGVCSSDVRLKRDIVPFVHLLDKVAQLQPVHFYWRAEEFKERHFGTKPSYGLIAQEVEKVLPELVTEDEQGYKAVNYAKLPLLSLQAIKELKAENDALKQKLSDQQASAALQQQQLQQQQQELAAIKKLLCLSKPQADLCKAK